jgi:signal transduction histidine kinase
VGGRLWGLIAIASAREEPPAPETEARLSDFTELLATAIANAEAQAELAASRARIIATADETRRRIERDLHDGAQQRLVSLGLQLQGARAALPPGIGEVAAELDGVARGLTSTLEELREYARGIHPAILSESGLALALKAVARRSAVPVVLDVRTTRRLPEPIEVGVYYVVSEALANVSKHAEASRATVDVQSIDGVVRASVRDDGIGGAAFLPGSGLVGLKDRVEALGGRMALESPPGAGTCVAVEVPVGDDGGER